jgi:hypothetical protein
MTFSDDCPCGRSQDLTFAESNDKIVIDRKIFNQVFELICSSVDEISNARRREIFLFSLDYHLTQSQVFDDSARIQASLLLDAYYDFVPVGLAELERNFQEACELMRGVNHD